ncbi:hypothetical protein LOAG_09995 [Loa loa]|uniref:Uncharacterized protein n=1 Tax=Loa loa TaxID=7209 RepID=A0A1S0TSB7_LOALO|nr:hypothetical protein LOAG_09995 [Loa loa]EFO18501.1 hypothetical protein LOAG_09995 [Loa loa]
MTTIMRQEPLLVIESSNSSDSCNNSSSSCSSNSSSSCCSSNSSSSCCSSNSSSSSSSSSSRSSSSSSSSSSGSNNGLKKRNLKEKIGRRGALGMMMDYRKGIEKGERVQKNELKRKRTGKSGG